MKMHEGRTAIVTGAGRGIGRAIAICLAREGADVAVVDRFEEGLAATVEAIEAHGVRALGVRADISDEGDIDRLFGDAVGRFGRLDILVNNAGISLVKPFPETTVDEWDRTFNTNLRAMFLTCRRALPELIARGGGSIVNIASVAAFHHTVPHVHYSASKAGVVALTRELALELAPDGIRVNAIAPGPIDSAGRMQELSAEARAEAGKRFPLGRIGRPEDIAEAVAFLASDRAGYITGVTLPVTGGAELRLGLPPRPPEFGRIMRPID
jgi:NAD(P)-dependent dehydrogenase (short-subunit alcohol dehydrogenase family)